MPEPELYTFDTFAYYNDCNPLLWFIMIQDMPPSTPPYCKARNRGALWNAPVMPIVQRKLCLMGAASRDAGINITDVICAPSLKCILLADSFIEGYESKLDDKDQVLEMKIDGGFSESLDYYHQHEQLKTNVMESGFRVDKTHDTSYKYPEYCNYESFDKMDERIHETLKSIRTKYADSTNRTMAVFVNKSLESVLQFITKEPPIPLELYIARKAEAKNELVGVSLDIYTNDVVYSGLGINRKSQRNFKSLTAVERKSFLMGTVACITRLNITDVICSPSTNCINAADSFIKGFQLGKNDEMNVLKIKIDGGFSSTAEGYYLHKEFRSLVVERGYDVDDSYETSVQWPGNYKVDPYVDLEWRLSAALDSMRYKYPDTNPNVVAVFVDKSLGSMLSDIAGRSQLLINMEIPPSEDTPLTQENTEK
ncbi:hypothetical protein T12_9142 [Trichinella patagoniensis]|uniref:Uncharacterized protein n=1 Tax=Trichinella patagoniensis TaxID=990121 RepID=A0A0V0ZVK2_9BILA|nr:hypothetical protein T12_9142 [Trichinella patagoniensis]